MTSDIAIYYTDHIIDKVAEEYGYDRELVKKLYYFYQRELIKKMRYNPDPAYYIPNLGTLYLTLYGVTYALKDLEELRERRGDEHKTLVFVPRYQKKREKIKEYIAKLKEAGNSKIAYFDKIFNPKTIKNA